MKTFNKGQVSCDNCWLAIHAPNGGYICMEQIGKSLFEMPGCPGAITDKTVRKAHAAVLKERPWEAVSNQLNQSFAEWSANLRSDILMGLLRFQKESETPAAGLNGEDSVTERGFGRVNFLDDSGKKCSLQISSRAVCENEDGSVDDQPGWIWLGIDNPTPIILKTKARDLGMPLPPGEVCGWMPYPVPDDVQISTRMHLNAAQVRGLITRLQTWLDTGSFQEQPLGTVAEPAGPPPASELPKIGADKTKVKIEVKIAMNLDLIAEYFHHVAWLREEEKDVDRHPVGFFRGRARKTVQHLQQKKSALEAKIMEKLMAK
jgi:hypothetical protein